MSVNFITLNYERRTLMTPEWIVELFNNFAVPVVMLIVFIVGIVMLFKHYSEKDDKHDSELKELTEKYY